MPRKTTGRKETSVTSQGTDGPAEDTGPEVTGAPAEHTEPDYWTEERMRAAEPAPMPTPPEGQ